MNNTVTSLTLKQFVMSLKQCARKACRTNTDLTIWNDSYFYDIPAFGWPIDPFWADGEDTERCLAINNDKTNKLAIIGVNWHFGDPYVFTRVLTPVDDPGDDNSVKCGDDVYRCFSPMGEEEDDYTLTFNRAEGDSDNEHDYAMYCLQDVDCRTPEDMIEYALELIGH